MRRLLFAALLATSLGAQGLEEKIRQIIESSPAARRAFWGIAAGAPDSDEMLYQLNPDQFFVPASNTKLFTAALALTRLGPDYRFKTVVLADKEPDATGRLAGDLRLVGGGDPALSARAVPYQKGPILGNPLQAIEALADQVVARGVRAIAGDVVGDDTAYVWAPYPDGWAFDDQVWEYGAPVSALVLHDNAVLLKLHPNGKTAPAVALTPPVEYFTIDNRVRAGPFLERKIELERGPGTRQIRLWGTMRSDPAGFQFHVAIDDPAHYAAFALADALTRRGVAIRGRPVARHRWPGDMSPPGPDPGVELARRDSPPLVELLRILLKVSQNLHTEIMLREVARQRKGIGSREAGLEETQAFLAEVGIGPAEVNLRDGSGLSRLNLVTPAAVLRLLRFLYRSPQRDAWIALLPLGGEDGTLANRFAGAPEAARVHAKTGSLSHVAALSGYVQSASRGWLAFSILANNFNAPAVEVRAVIDKIGLALAE